MPAVIMFFYRTFELPWDVDPEEPEPPRRHKFTEDGLVVGLDGENPVSNENPDPLAVRGARRP